MPQGRFGGNYLRASSFNMHNLQIFIVIDIFIAILAIVIRWRELEPRAFFPTRWNPTNDVDSRKRIIPFVWESPLLERRYNGHVCITNCRRLMHANRSPRLSLYSKLKFAIIVRQFKVIATGNFFLIFNNLKGLL